MTMKPAPLPTREEMQARRQRRAAKRRKRKPRWRPKPEHDLPPPSILLANDSEIERWRKKQAQSADDLNEPGLLPYLKGRTPAELPNVETTEEPIVNGHQERDRTQHPKATGSAPTAKSGIP